jgi:CubicO group peptidase (beta-lactamase class C family)
MAVMQLEEKGLLQVEDALSKFIPDYPMGEQITIRHLLTHSSGITNLWHRKSFKDKWISCINLIPSITPSKYSHSFSIVL